MNEVPVLTRQDLSLNNDKFNAYLSVQDELYDMYLRLKHRGQEYTYGLFDYISYVDFVKFAIKSSSVFGNS